MKYLILFFFAAVCSFASDLTKLEWQYSERVKYAENHDPSMIWLQDGRKLHVEYTAISWEEVDKWKPGRALAITYAHGVGVRLRDDATNKLLPIMCGLPEHPIDVLLNRYEEQFGSTAEMVELSHLADKEWEAEINRLEKELLKRLPPAGQSAFRKAEKSWEAFVDAESKNIGKIHDQEGTIHLVLAAKQFMNLKKERALTLLSYLGDVP